MDEISSRVGQERSGEEENMVTQVEIQNFALDVITTKPLGGNKEDNRIIFAFE
jgi:hypothetical protein